MELVGVGAVTAKAMLNPDPGRARIEDEVESLLVGAEVNSAHYLDVEEVLQLLLDVVLVVAHFGIEVHKMHTKATHVCARAVLDLCV